MVNICVPIKHLGAHMISIHGGLKYIVFILFLSFLSPISFSSNASKPIVVCTTTVLSSIVYDLAKDKVIVEVISSPAVCPAHYDIKPSDIDMFRSASLIFIHGIEPWINDLKMASGSNATIIKVTGPWNTPEKLREKYILIANMLEKYLKLNLTENLYKCLKAINETEEYLIEYSLDHGFKDFPVICMAWQQGFINFLGFKIIAVYGPPEKISMRQYENIVKNASQAGAVLIIDNIQSGVEFGEKLASTIGGVEVSLTNFPGISPELKNMTMVMKWNAERLGKAIMEAKLKGEINRLREEIKMWRMVTIVSSILTIVLLIICVSLILKIRRK